MLLKDFRPQSKLVTKTTQVHKPKFPVIDAHNHLGEVFGGGWDKKPLSQLLDLLDEAGVTHYVDLDGGWGEDILDAHLKHFKAGAPERFQIFGGVEWSKWPELGNQFPAWAAKRLIAQKERGAQGLKIWKPFGLHVKDQHGKLADVDDERLSPIWQTAGELGLPVLIHVADPVAFFDPIDETNERWEEVGAHPDWAFTSPPFPPFLHILEGFKNLVTRHASTIFIGAHMGCYAENLEWVGQMLEACPNYYIDISARFGEIGRQPYTARNFFIRYQDRILYGSDFSPKLEAYRLSYRLLETDDEYFNYSVGEIPRQGRFYAYGLRLPDDVLRKIYRENAAKILNIR
ncbi:MAG: amidohydrolase family protein [Anaerolineales bacterium]|nr:amidohydrolase family protein [Anaerolineales bacterium]MCZ2121429.1 amidohydrolase family protein [Anaerolineales bacterium]